MDDLLLRLEAVNAAAVEYRDARAAVPAARARLAAALVAAHAAGASYTLLGKLVGMSRQRVKEIIDSSSSG